MAETTDKLLDMADELVSQLVIALAAEAFSLDFTAKWSDDVSADLSDDALQTPQLWVIDAAETLLPGWTSSANGCPIEEFDLLLVVQRKFASGDDKPAECRKLSALVSEITRFCRATCILNATCIQTKRDPARNLDAYHNEGLFRAAIVTTWRRVLDDDE